jgi:uncharacterized protein YwqG
MLGTDEIFKHLSNAELSRVLPDIQMLMQESIRLSLIPLNPAPPPVGISRLGGLPDLPRGFIWPACKGIPMSFIAQVRLEDIAVLPPSKKLPQAGLITFFYDSSQNTYGESPDDRGGWGVYFFDPAVCLSLGTAAAPVGLPGSAIFKAYQLGFSSEISLPTSAAQHLHDLDWSKEEVHHYEDFLYGFPTSEDHAQPHHRMFGHPDQIQDDMQIQSALFANGVPSIDDPRAGNLIQRKEDWLLLLQVDSDARTGMKWATSGMLYYWINIAALSARKFDNTWLVLQAE